MQRATSPSLKCAVPLQILDRYYMSRLKIEEAGEIRTHIQSCETCREYLDELDVITRALRLAATDGD